MTRFHTLIAVSVLLAVVPSGLAAPTCNKSKICSKLTKMGNNVKNNDQIAKAIKDSGISVEDWINKVCPSHSGSAGQPQATQSQDQGSAPAPAESSKPAESPKPSPSPTTSEKQEASAPTSGSNNGSNNNNNQNQDTTSSTTTTSSPKIAAAASTGGSSSTSDSDQQAYLDGHNTLRAKHGANPLTWSDSLASQAAAYASQCKFVHSGTSGVGENLAAGSGDYSIASALNSWASEESSYTGDGTAGHYTQMVWKSTTQVGCGVATCAPGTIFDASYGSSKYYVCQYTPPGNVIGQYDQNVQ